ncbi:MAG: hypothetical protein OHK0039_43150 [Bacteroidia bacterium]
MIDSAVPTLHHLVDTPADLLRAYGASPETGFVPETDPLQRLSPAFDAWEQAADALPDRLNAGCLPPAIAALPLLDADRLAPDERERALLLLGMLSHAYLQASASRVLPAVLAQPWAAVAAQLGRPPVLAHASFALQNWRRIDPTGSNDTENLAPLFRFHGGMDESWFITATVHVEAVGAQALYHAARLRLALDAADMAAIVQALEDLEAAMARLTPALMRLRERCAPFVFYYRLRPYLASLTEVHYEGVDAPGATRSYAGGSAAQSALVQSLDAVLGIDHAPGMHSQFLQDMRRYMPPQHAALIGHLARGRRLTDLFGSDPALAPLHQACAGHLLTFRNAHMKIVSEYILAFTKGEAAVGTGGTNPLEFLQALRNQTARTAKP